ncbi:MAG: nucleotide exchange factor GrpE [Clostridia bacterium]|nr:nucleotide exchange factor GrpE [Clostridia bacterium]
MAFNKKKNAEAEAPEAAQEETPVEENQAEAETEAEARPQEESALEKAQAQAEEYLNLAQRVQADFENYRRRTKATRAEAFEDGAREVIKQLLPVVDNLERAIAQETTDEAMATGVKMVYRQLMDALEKRGVSVIDRPGEKFDPNLENAVMQGTTDEGEPGTVCAVLQKGYKLGEFVLRHAMVKVVEG